MISGRRKRIVLAAWMVVPTLVAAGYVLAALRRPRGVAAALLPLGPLYAVILMALGRPSLLRPLWGLHLGLAAGLTSTAAGVGLVWPRHRAAARARRALGR